tara:strand:- start:3271 stop:4653 length:1383 start_codon:yes stop_codon:yes gene_type:complete
MILNDLKNADIIIFGSGLAAYCTGKSLAYSNKKILFLEGGSEIVDNKSLKLSKVDDYGHLTNHWSNHWLRVIGGTSKVWAGWTAPFQKSDFLNWPWPIDLDNLYEYYIKAWNELGRDGENEIKFYLEQENNLEEFYIRPFVLINDPLSLSFKDYEKIENSKLIKNTHLIKLYSENRNKIDSFDINFNGKKLNYKLHNRQKIVLAMGGVGNAQILLQPDNQYKVPVGNESGQVGKYLMEHPLITAAAEVILDNKKNVFGKFAYGTKDYKLSFSLNKNILLKSENLLNCSIIIDHFKLLRELDKNLLNNLKNMLSEDLTRYEVQVMSEQEPVKDNSILISDEKNSAGIYDVNARCIFSRKNFSSIEENLNLFGQFLAKNNLGFLKINNDNIYRNWTGSGHTMGTTRMSDNFSTGVVNENLQHFNYNNLFIIGSSVFPSGGAINPTLSIMALAFKLSDYLKKV